MTGSIGIILTGSDAFSNLTVKNADHPMRGFK
jgi:hypothetical protein